MIKKKKILICILIALIGFTASLVFSFLIFPIIQEPLKLNLDPDKYGELAKNIYSGTGFKFDNSKQEILDRPPLYPYLLALIFYVSNGVNFQIVQVVQAVFHSMTCVLVFVLLSKITSQKIAFIAQFISAVHPVLLWYTSRIWIESFYTMIFFSTIILYMKSYESLNQGNAIYSGILTGIVLLTKSILFFFPFLLLVFFYFKKGLKGLQVAASIILISLLILSPWVIRNYLLTNSILFIPSNLGQNMILGDALAQKWSQKPFNNLDAWEDGYSKIKLILHKDDLNTYTPADDKKLIKAYIEENIKHPQNLFWRIFVNFLTFWYLSESTFKSLVFLGLQLPVLIILLTGIKKLIKSFDSSWILILVILYYSIIHSLIIGWGRYSVPLIPIMLVMVAIILNYKKSRTHFLV